MDLAERVWDFLEGPNVSAGNSPRVYVLLTPLHSKSDIYPCFRCLVSFITMSDHVPMLEPSFETVSLKKSVTQPPSVLAPESVPLVTASPDLQLDNPTSPADIYKNLLTRLRKQGKAAELRAELDSGGKKDKNFSAKKIAMKKIVANMTMNNNDMITLFPDVIAQMQIPSIDIKKM